VSYNGWRNYETWDVALWIDNDQGSYYYARELVADAARDAEPETRRIDVADALKEWFEAGAPEMAASAYSDLLNAAMGEVDWLEIADHYLSDLEDEETAS
jgi:hypothetical protein